MEEDKSRDFIIFVFSEKCYRYYKHFNKRSNPEDNQANIIRKIGLFGS